MNYFALIIFIISYLGHSQNSLNTTSVQKSAAHAALKDSLRAMVAKTDDYWFKGKYDKAISHSITNIKFAEKIGDSALAYYSRYVMAAVFMHLEDYKNAHDYAKIYTDYAEREKNAFIISRAYNLLGVLYTMEKKYDMALPYLEKALPLSIKQGDTVETSIIYYNLSEIYLNKKDTKKANIYIEKAKKDLAAINHKAYEPDLYLLEGKINLEENNPKTAAENLKLAITIFEKGNYSDVRLIESYKEYSNALYTSGDFKEAFLARKTFDSLSAIQFKKEKVMSIQNANAQFGVNQYKKQAKQAELEKELIIEKAKRSTILLYFFIGAAIFLGVFIIFLYRGNKRKKILTQTLKEKNIEYLKAKEESEQLAKAKSKFFSTVSHELRTPLYGVIGLTSILLEDKTLKNHRTDLKSLKFSADYLLALINDVLHISKLESKTIEDIQIPFNLHELIKSITSSFQYVLIQNKNKLVLDISKEIPKTIIGNHVVLSQIIMNLLGNASKFTNNGEIRISAKKEALTEEDITIIFNIQDTGVGIPKEKQLHVFEEFQQVDSQRHKQQGTGLGLPIVKKLLEASNATIQLESEVGKGSTFTFTLKFKNSKELHTEKLIQNNKGFLEGKTILIVDDNRINQIVTKKILEKHKLNCFIAENGDQAIEKIKEVPCDLILMDINMPGKNGIETTKEIREFNKTTPILALTAIEAEEIREKIKNAGMNGIIIKPYNVDQFLNIILRTLTNSPETLNTEEYVYYSQ